MGSERAGSRQGDPGWPAVEAAYGSKDYIAIPDVQKQGCNNNLINRHSVAGSTRTVARTVGSDQGQYLVLGKMGGKRGRVAGR